MHAANTKLSVSENSIIPSGEDGICRSSDAQLIRSLFEITTEYLIEHDRSGKIIQASSALTECLGYDSVAFCGLATSEVVDQDYLDSLDLCFQDTGAPGPKRIEGTLRHSDGTGLLYRGMALIVQKDGAEVVLASLREVESPTRQFHVTQAQKLEAIGQLAAGIAHEINTPTQYVGNNVRFLQDSFLEIMAIVRPLLEFVQAAESNEVPSKGNQSIRDQMEAVDFDFLSTEIPRAFEQTLEGVERITRIVRAMKEFSHPDTKERSLIRINNAIENTITVAKNEWKYVAKIVTDLDPSIPMVSCYPGEFNQVLLNILVNAAHAIAEAKGDSGPMGTITVSTRAVEGFVEIRFKDTGTGIPIHAQPRIFDPFFTTKEVGKGTGQGLALSYAIVVENHGGTITFETEMGVGTTFIITIPIGSLGGQEDN